MAIWDIFKARTEAEDRLVGTITDLRVERTDSGERWLFHLDSRPNEDFVFEPSFLSPKRHRGEHVAVTVERGRAGAPRPVDQISAA